MSEALEAVVGDGLRDTDAACRSFAETLKWPTLTDRVRLEVCLRLECAGWYCNERFDASWEGEDWTNREFLQELLVEHWHEGGHQDWLKSESQFPGLN